MSAAVEKVVEFPSSRRAPSSAPVHKLRVMERLRCLIREDEEERQRWKEEHQGDGRGCPATLTVAALAIVQYLAEVTDKDAGVAIVGKQKIAERIGRSRATVKRQLRRLRDLGLIEREKRGNGKWRYVNAYRLVDIRTQVSPAGVADDPTQGHQRPPHIDSPDCSNPDGLVPSSAEAADSEPAPPNHAQHDKVEDEKSGALDRYAWAEWAARRLKDHYADHGPDAFQQCRDDIDAWAAALGERALRCAFENAKDAKLYGPNLLHFIRRTHPQPDYPGLPESVRTASVGRRHDAIKAAGARFAGRRDP